MAEKKDKLQRPISKSGDPRGQAALDQVRKIRIETRDELERANARMRVHEAAARFLILHYVIRKLKDDGKTAGVMHEMLNAISDSLTPRERYEQEKVDSDNFSLGEIINQYYKKL